MSGVFCRKFAIVYFAGFFFFVAGKEGTSSSETAEGSSPGSLVSSSRGLGDNSQRSHESVITNRSLQNSKGELPTSIHGSHDSNSLGKSGISTGSTNVFPKENGPADESWGRSRGSPAGAGRR